MILLELNPKTAVEPPITPKHAEKTMTYLKNASPFWSNQYLFQAFDLSACICVHLRLTAFYSLKGKEVSNG